MNNYQFKSVQDLEIHSLIKKITLFTFLIFLAILAMLFLPWQQTVTGYGKLIAYDPSQRDYAILSTVNGFVEKYFVQENEFVKKGQPLCQIVDKDQNLSQRFVEQEQLLLKQQISTQEQIEIVKSQIVSLKLYYQNGLKIYDTKLEQSKQKIESLHLQNEAMKKDFIIQENQYKRMESLKDIGIESLRSYEKAKNEYLRSKMMYEKNGIDISIEEKNYHILDDEKLKFSNKSENSIGQLERNLLQTKVSLKNINTSIVSLKSKSESYSSRVIKAPKDGIVVRILQNDINKLLKEGDKLIHFAPKVSQRSILLKVSDFNMPLIKENLPVRIMFYGWPAMQISGWPTISYGTFGGYVKSVEPLTHEEGAYYLHVFETKDEPWPDENVLKLGTKAVAWIRLETVSIWYQIWRYINAMPPNMPSGGLEYHEQNY